MSRNSTFYFCFGMGTNRTAQGAREEIKELLQGKVPKPGPWE